MDFPDPSPLLYSKGSQKRDSNSQSQTHLNIFYSFFSPHNPILQAGSSVVKVAAIFKGHIFILISLCSLSGNELLTILFLKFSATVSWGVVCSRGSTFGSLPAFTFSSHNAIHFHGSDHLPCAENFLIYTSRLSCFCKIQFQPIYQSSYFFWLSQWYLKLIASITHFLSPIKFHPFSCSFEVAMKGRVKVSKIKFVSVCSNDHEVRWSNFTALLKISLSKFHLHPQESLQLSTWIVPWALGPCSGIE